MIPGVEAWFTGTLVCTGMNVNPSLFPTISRLGSCLNRICGGWVQVKTSQTNTTLILMNHSVILKFEWLSLLVVASAVSYFLNPYCRVFCCCS